MTEAVSMGIKHILLKTKSEEEKLTQRELKRLKLQRSRVREELETAMNNYNHVTENGLMDFYIYEIRAKEALEQYLIHEIRKLEKGL